MSKFNAGTAVERLEYDFTDYGGQAGFIKEPTTGAVNRFTAASRAMMREAQSLQGLASSIPDVENMDDEQMLEQMSKMDAATEQVTAFQRKSMENLAILCGAEWEYEAENAVLVGGSPTLAELEALPFRVLQAFTQWLMGEIRPKRTTPGTRR